MITIQDRAPPRRKYAPSIQETDGDRTRGILILGLITVGVVGFFLISRGKRQKTLALRPSNQIALRGGSAQSYYSPETMSATAGLLHYKNTEIRNIEWNDDGLPTKLVIEREYYQLP